MGFERCCYCKIETASLVFAIINCVAASAFCLLDIGVVIYLGICVHQAGSVNPLVIYRGSGNQLVLDILGALICLGPALLTFLFAVLLVNGISKKKPGQILAYFIYGIFVNLLSVAGFTTLAGNLSPYYCFGFVLCLLYSLMLAAVWTTYRNIQMENDYRLSGHELLENC